MNKKKAITVVELMIVVSILAVLYAIVNPVIMQAKSRSKESTCISNLRSITVALNNYRSDLGGTDAAAPSSAMGFPEIAYRALEGEEAMRTKEIRKHWVCQGMSPREGSHAAYAQMWAPPVGSVIHTDEKELEWISHVEKMGSSSVVFQDWNHQTSHPINPWSVQRSIGAHLDGSVRVKVRRGDSRKLNWWE